MNQEEKRINLTLRRGLCLQLCAFMLISSLAFSQSDSLVIEPPLPKWIYIGQGIDKGNIYLRSSYVSKTNSTYKVWIKAIHPVLEWNKKVYPNATSVTLFEINCYTKQYKLVQDQKFTAAKKALSSTTQDYAEWKDAAPETIIERVVEKACELFADKE